MKKIYFFELFMLFVIFLFSANVLRAQETFYTSFDGGGNDVGVFATPTSDGGYIVVGKTNSFGNGDYDVWLIRTDTNGEALWKKSYGGLDNDEGRCVQQTADGGFIIAANSVNPGHFNQGWVFKTDSGGTIVWDYKFGGNMAGDEASFVLPAKEGGYLVSGTVDQRSFVFNIDDSGQITWSQKYFLNNSSIASAICPIHDGWYIVSGAFEFPVGGSWYPNLFYIKGNGELITQVTWTSYPAGSASFVSTCNDGGVISGGSWSGTPFLLRMTGMDINSWEYSYSQTGADFAMTGAVQLPDSNFVSSGNWYSAAMLGMNDAGEQTWQKYGRLDNDDIFFKSMQKVDDNHLILTGYKNEGDVDHDIILVKSTVEGSLEGTKNNSWTKSESLMQSFPNPFSVNTTFTFALRDAAFVKLIIADFSGRKVKSLANKNFLSGEHHIVWDGTNDLGVSCADGVYFATLSLSSGLMQTVKLVKTSR